MAERPDFPCPATGLDHCPDHCGIACMRLDAEPGQGPVDCSGNLRPTEREHLFGPYDIEQAEWDIPDPDDELITRWED